MSFARILLVILAFTTRACLAADPPTYNLIDLGISGEDFWYSAPSTIDDRDDIGGFYASNDETYVGWVTHDQGRHTRYFSIRGNASTEVVGVATTGLVGGETDWNGPDPSEGYISDASGRHARIVHGPHRWPLTVLGMNGLGQLVGMLADQTDFQPHAFVTGPLGTGFVDLGSPPSWGYAINDAMQATGYFTVDGQMKVFLSNRRGDVRDLGILGYGAGLNNRGQVCGSLQAGEHYDAFITEPDGRNARDLGLIPESSGTFLVAINEAGQAVGYANLPDKNVAIVTNSAGTALYRLDELTDPGDIELSAAYGINVHGHIVASSTNGHSYLLIPK